MKKSRLFIAASFGSLAMVIASPSFAQTTTAPQDPEEEAVVKTAEVPEDTTSAIVVTGSRIRRDTFSTIEGLIGGSGNDTIVVPDLPLTRVVTGGGADTVTGGSGVDTVVVSATLADVVRLGISQDSSGNR